MLIVPEAVQTGGFGGEIAAVIADSAAYARVVPCQSADASCVRQFVEDFGRQAFRRPLTADG